ncbi:hypothetical protein [Anaeroselena agilis]|uniref:Uncharacterized protein n=1 Tax=Anaeroselena agilis TaxID=3063788 RepID=A0ABU3NUG1_9FIRM|nr:hypothetical protein [Selenomonadales bacterium 4137-cl]
MRRFLLALVVVSVLNLLSAPPAVYAEEGVIFHRPTVAMLPVINNSGQKRTEYITEIVTEALYAKFGSGRYLLVDGQTLDDALRRQGIDDIHAASDAALFGALRNLGIDYAARAEIHPLIVRQRVHFPDVFLLMKAWSASVPVTFAVTNVRTGGYAYEAYFNEYAKHDFFIGFADRHQAIRLALDKVVEKFAQEQISLE